MNQLKTYMALLCCTASLSAYAADIFGPQEPIAKNAINDIALVVNEDAITQHQLQKEMAAAKKIIVSEGKSKNELKTAITEHVIMQHLIQQLMQQASINISDAKVDSTVRQIASDNSVSVSELYKKVAAETGMSAAEYRAAIKSQVAQNQLKQLVVGNSIQITNSQIESQIAQIARQRGATMHLQDLLVPIPSGEADQRAAGYNEVVQTISQALEDNSNNLELIRSEIPNSQFNDLGNINIADIPTKFAEAVANLSSGAVLNVPIVDIDGMHFLKVVSKTDASGKSYKVREAKVRHILVREDASYREGSKRLINEIYKKLQNGADFSALALEYSQDPGSSIKGGDLGWVNANEVDPTFSREMLSVPLNRVSAPFKSSFGWHIIEVSQRKTVDRTEDVLRAQIRNSLYNDALEKAWQQKLAEVRRSAYIKIFE